MVGCRKTGALKIGGWEYKMISFWKAIWQFFTKLKIYLLHNPVIPILDIYMRIKKISLHKDLHTNLPSSFIPYSQKLETAQWPNNRGMDKHIVVLTEQ